MTVRLYVSFAADLVAVVLMICQLVRMKKLPVENESLKGYFRIFSCLVMAMSVIYLLGAYAGMQIDALTPQDYVQLYEADKPAWIWTAVAAAIIDIFLSTVFLYMWIAFLSWFLFEDRKFIRRRFWLGYAPLIIAAAVTSFSIPMAVMSEEGFWFYVVAVCVFFVVRLIYFLLALWLLREYKEQNGYLRFFNPWVFFVPVFAGWVLQDVFYWGFSALGSTLGVMLLYASIISEQRYSDQETGLYNRDFIGYLKELISRGKYNPSSAMTFTLEQAGEMKAFSKILKKQLPKNCEPILRSDREVVVLTNVTGRGPLTMVMEDVKAEFEVKADCTLKKKAETAEEFMERVL